MAEARVPTEADWGDWKGDLDIAYAHDRVIGKTMVEAEFVFASAPLGACEARFDASHPVSVLHPRDEELSPF